MLILRIFCENSPRIIAASGVDPVLKYTALIKYTLRMGAY
jgi:hypothetical protein